MTTIEKDKVRNSIYAQRDKFVRLAHEIHEHPELAFAEELASARITEVLANEGFAVRKGVYGMPTAFVATIGNGPLHMAFCAEYDALPPACLGAVSSGGTSDQNKLGLVEVWLSSGRKDSPLQHACGHNLIAGAAVAAAVGLGDIADKAGLTVSVFGTPGEELCGLPEPPDGHLAGGKVALLEAGAFERVHAVLMIHPGPSPWSMFYPTHIYLRQRARFSSAGGRSIGIAEMRLLKLRLQQTVTSMHQIPALFAARPEWQQIGAQADLLWIASSSAEGVRAGDAVRHCFEGAASSAGVAVEIIEYAVNAELRNDPTLSASYRENSRALGRVRERDEHIQEEIREIFSSPQLPLATRLIAPLLRIFPRLVAPPGLFMDKCPVELMYGTDLASVSQVIPCIHPLIGIGGMAGPHSAEFTAQADTDEAYRAMLDGGVALAWTALDAAIDPALRAHLLESERRKT
jgi:metal-dependent amidase/aminoacylase/carboxypeptidase family protein